MFAVFKHWIDNHWHDFSKDRELISELEKFCRTCVQYDPSLKAPAEQVATSLHNKVLFQKRVFISQHDFFMKQNTHFIQFVAQSQNSLS